MLATFAIPLLAKTGEAAKSGPIGLAVIIVLCIACYFLFKSMSKHLRRVRDKYPDGFPPQPPADGPDARRADRHAGDDERTGEN
jgi:hypothetical protein